MKAGKKRARDSRKFMRTKQAERQRRQIFDEEAMNSENNAIKIRQRMARVLTVTGILTWACWVPYVVCEFYAALGPDKYSTLLNVLSRCCLLLGLSHSAISPIIYWIVNRDSLTCSADLRSCFQHCKMPWRNSPRPTNSSLEEMALRPINPNFIRPQVP